MARFISGKYHADAACGLLLNSNNALNVVATHRRGTTIKKTRANWLCQGPIISVFPGEQIFWFLIREAETSMIFVGNFAKQVIAQKYCQSRTWKSRQTSNWSLWVTNGVRKTVRKTFVYTQQPQQQKQITNLQYWNCKSGNVKPSMSTDWMARRISATRTHCGNAVGLANYAHQVSQVA